MASLDQIISYIGDNTVVEHGTDGEWEYLKYANGVAEAWANLTVSPTSYAFTTSQQSGKYYTNASWTGHNFDLPTGLFIEAPTVLASISNNGYLVYGVVGASNDGSSFTVRAFSLYSVTYNISKVYAYAIGRWK